MARKKEHLRGLYGLTAMVVIGKWGGFNIELTWGLRIVLGWVSISLLYVDIERMLGAVMEIADRGGDG